MTPAPPSPEGEPDPASAAPQPVRRRRLPRWARILIALGSVPLLGLLALFVVLRFFLGDIVAARMSGQTGFPTRIARLQIDPFSATVHLQGLEIDNPPGFPDPEFVRLRELRLDFDRASLTSPEVRIEDGLVDLERIVLATNAEGVRNDTLLRERLMANAQRGEVPVVAPGGGEQKVHARRLAVRLEHARVVVAGRGGRPPVVTELPLGFDRTFYDVRDASDIVRQVLPSSALRSGRSLLDRMGDLFR